MDNGAAMNALTTVSIVIVKSAIHIIEKITWHTLNQGKHGFVLIVMKEMNEYSLYKEAVTFMQKYKGRSPYAHFIKAMGLTDAKTPDNIKWRSSQLDY